jgi:rfaE bifunctional protein nucleotidyltransferase chain/domain
MTILATDRKMCSFAELEQHVASARAQGKRVVLCHGVFDLMHPGHVLHLKAAREFGDMLVVTLTPDQYVNKGPGRPVFTQRLRSESIAALEVVDYVALNLWPTAIKTIEQLKPDVYVKGSEYADPSRDLTGKILEEEEMVRAVGGRIAFTHEETFSSSTLINQFFSNLPTYAQDYLRQFRQRHSVAEVLGALHALADLDVLVVGEAIIDEYCYCVPLGKVPKDTIIATKHIGEDRFAGGSLAVANHIAGFCRSVTLVTYLGPDDAHEDFVRSKLGPNVTLAVVRTPERPTIVKRRYVESVFLSKLFEVQLLDDRPLSAEAELEISDALGQGLPAHDLAVVTDFGHGLMTDAIRTQLASARFLAVNTQTNSANLGFNPVTRYAHADYVCMHEGELKLSLRAQYGDIQHLGSRLRSELTAGTVMITRGPNGSMLFAGDDIYETPALAGRVVDRVGAGDAVLSVTAPCVFRGVAPDVVGFIANCVGALAVEIVGNREPVTLAALSKFITHVLA